MKRLAIVIPVKSPREGKSRLAGMLQAAERYDLNLELMRHTFDQVAPLAEAAEVYVVSKSFEVLGEAMRRGFRTCSEPEHFELNDALSLAAEQLRRRGRRRSWFCRRIFPGSHRTICFSCSRNFAACTT